MVSTRTQQIQPVTKQGQTSIVHPSQKHAKTFTTFSLLCRAELSHSLPSVFLLLKSPSELRTGKERANYTCMHKQHWHDIKSSQTHVYSQSGLASMLKCFKEFCPTSAPMALCELLGLAAMHVQLNPEGINHSWAVWEVPRVLPGCEGM